MQTEPKEGAQKVPRRRSRSVIRAAVVATIGLLAMGFTAATANAEPVLTLDRDTDLRTGQQVNVSGTDFVHPTPPTGGPGMYVALTAEVNGETVVDRSPGSDRWIRFTDDNAPPADAGEKTLDPITGDFPAGEITVYSKLRATDGTLLADCLEIQCYVSGIQAHAADPSVYASAPIQFEQTDRRILLDPRSSLDTKAETTVRVGGFDFDIADAPDGFNVAQGQLSDGAYLYSSPLLVKPGADTSAGEVELSPSGDFFARLPVSAKRSATGGDIDCEFVPCSIIIWPAGEEPTTSNVLENEAISFAFNYSPRVTLSQSRNLGAEATVTVEGAGFPAGPPGLYVAQAAWVNGKLTTAAQDRSGTASDIKFIRLGGPTADTKLNPDGTFTTSIVVKRTLTVENGQKVNCVEENCHIITWRAHTDPSTDTVYTYGPLSFDEDPVVAPRIRVVKRQQVRVGRAARALPLATVVCGTKRCAVRTPKRAILRIGKQRLALPVIAPRNVARGKRAVVRLRVNGKAARALVGRRARVKFRVAVRSASGNRVAVVNRALVGARKVKRG